MLHHRSRDRTGAYRGTGTAGLFARAGGNGCADEREQHTRSTPYRVSETAHVSEDARNDGASRARGGSHWTVIPNVAVAAPHGVWTVSVTVSVPAFVAV
jgi:hypothetical protein